MMNMYKPSVKLVCVIVVFNILGAAVLGSLTNVFIRGKNSGNIR